MRFATRFDRWLVALSGCCLSAWPPPQVRSSADRDAGSPSGSRLATVFLPWVIWAIVLPCMLPQYYEVRESGLFIRQGWRKILIPYGSLSELRSVSDSRSAAVFSTQRILVGTAEGKRYIIAVAEEERFRTEVYKRLPAATGSGVARNPSFWFKPSIDALNAESCDRDAFHSL